MFKKQKILNRPVSDVKFRICGFQFVSDLDIRISDFSVVVFNVSE